MYTGPGSHQPSHGLAHWHNRQRPNTLAVPCRLGDSAPPIFCLTHYQELMQSHGIVLVRGDIVRSNLLNYAEVRNTMLTWRVRKQRMHGMRFLRYHMLCASCRAMFGHQTVGDVCM